MFTLRDTKQQQSTLALNPKNWSKQANSFQSTNQPVDSLHVLQRNLGNGYIQMRIPQVERRDQRAGLQRACGNQAVLRMMRAWQPPTITASAGSSGSCAECEEKERKEPLRKAGNQSESTEVLPIVHEVLSSPGHPLDSGTRAFMEPRFGRDFSQVRVHTDSKAAESTRAVSALAYTVGKEVMFREGQYTPHTHQGRRLLAHELTHVVQQSHSERSLQRFSYKELKKKAYSGLISGLRTAKKAALDALRRQVGRLPRKHWGAANMIISYIGEAMEVILTMILEVIGTGVGVREGVIGLVEGLITLAMAPYKLLYDLVVGIFTNFDELKQDRDAIANALKNLPSTLKNMATDWLDRFNKASPEDQSLMIGELRGQIAALIASFFVPVLATYQFAANLGITAFQQILCTGKSNT